MCLRTEQLFDPRPRTKRQALFIVAAGFLLLVFPKAYSAQSRQQNDNATHTSDLAVQNLSRVAASPSEIKSLLLSVSGLMVELKR